jgi:molybdopterin molybdotransferase
MPRADNSAMDGFAVASASATGRLVIIGTAYAGHPFVGTVGPGSAVRITTGAPVPTGCDAVVPVEEISEQGGGVTPRVVPRAGDHVRRRGEEYLAGETLLEAGRVLHAGEIGLLASAGVTRVQVHPRPRVGLLSTGDELVELGVEPGPGQIVNSNRYLLAARLREAGCEVVPLGIARDRLDALSNEIQRGLAMDLLVSTGGVSVGERDHLQEALDGFGFERGFWKVAIKPGKPVLFGTVGGTPVFGLPGNPAAAAATCELFVMPALRRLAGEHDPLPPQLGARLTEDVGGGENRQRFLWGALREERGRYLFTPSPRQGSGQNLSLCGAGALLPVAAGSGGLRAGEEVAVLLLRLPPGRLG